MKRCPQCNRVEIDDALVFCRVDGTILIRDSSSLNKEAGTAKLGSTASESETSVLPHTSGAAMSRATGPTTVLPAASPATTGALAQQNSRRTAITIAVIAIVAAAAGLFKLFNHSQPRKAISFASAKITRLTTTGKATRVAISPDGKLVAYFYREEKSPWRIAVAPLEGGEPLKTFDLPATFGIPLRWTPDGRALAYVDTQKGVSNIVAQPLDGGAPKQLTDFKADRIFWFDFSRDGRQLALSRGTLTRDVILIKDAR